jgi:hypothetical protein
MFTIGSFWWLNARQGRLRSFEPQSFAAYVSPDKIRLRLPLVLYNTGAKPIVVQDLRLTFPEESGWTFPLPWCATRSQIKPAPDDGHAFPAVFSIAGRTAEQLFIEFGVSFSNITPLARDYQVRIEGKVGHRRKWRQLITFTLRGAHITDPGNYITYSNSPSGLTEEVIRRSEAALENLVKRIQARTRMSPMP